MAFYQRIRDLREDSDKTQSEIAGYLGTTTQYYGMYERGVTEIPFERAIALAKYYSVSLDYIAGLTNDKRGLYVQKSSYELTDKQMKAVEKLSATVIKSDDKRKKEKLTSLLSEIIKFIE